MLKDSSASRKGGLSCSKPVPFYSVSGVAASASPRREVDTNIERVRHRYDRECWWLPPHSLATPPAATLNKETAAALREKWIAERQCQMLRCATRMHYFSADQVEQLLAIVPRPGRVEVKWPESSRTVAHRAAPTEVGPDHLGVRAGLRDPLQQSQGPRGVRLAGLADLRGGTSVLGQDRRRELHEPLPAGPGRRPPVRCRA